MLDEQVTRLARERIRLEISEQNARLEIEINRIKAEMSARGVLNSGMTLLRIATLCADAAKDRAQYAWLTVHRFVTTAGVRYQDGLAQDLKSLVEEFLPVVLGDLRTVQRRDALHIDPICRTAVYVTRSYGDVGGGSREASPYPDYAALHRWRTSTVYTGSGRRGRSTSIGRYA